MSDIHIDDFYRDSAKILIALYNHFPRKMTIYVEDISGPDTPDEFGLHSQRHEACLHTMLWLANAGYLDYNDIVRQEALDQAVLTQDAFLILNSFLEPEDSSESTNKTEPDVPKEIAMRDMMAINVLRRELKSGTSYTLNKHLSALMQRKS